MQKPVIDLEKMPPEERLDLLERLWDSLSDEDLSLTKAQREELDRRLDELEQDGPHGIPWEEVLDRLRRNDS